MTAAIRLLTVHENVNPAHPWHSASLIYAGRITGGQFHQEQTPWGRRTRCGFGPDDLASVAYDPADVVNLTLQARNTARD